MKKSFGLSIPVLMLIAALSACGGGGGGNPPPAQPPGKLPETGQTKCYDASGAEIPCANTGQDGDELAGVAWPEPRFTLTYCDASAPCADQGSDCDANASTDVITDNLTGLMWTRSGYVAGTTKTWLNALIYANDLSLCGYTDWRLPNRNEQRSLINYGQASTNTWLNGQGFTNIQGCCYWSSTTYAPDSSIACDVNVDIGYLGTTAKTFASFMWPVRTVAGVSAPAELPETGQTTSASAGDDGALQMGVAWPSPRFTTNADTTVTDNLTGLVWAHDASSPTIVSCTGDVKTLQGALGYVACLNTNNYLGHADWRLPNVNELESLVHAEYTNTTLCGGSGCSDNAAWLNTQGFSNVQVSYYWSSTTRTASTTNAWYVDMYDGLINYTGKTGYYYVWPVRSGQ